MSEPHNSGSDLVGKRAMVLDPAYNKPRPVKIIDADVNIGRAAEVHAVLVEMLDGPEYRYYPVNALRIVD